MVINSGKRVQKMHEWARVAGELLGEDLKQRIYDNTLARLCGEISGKRVLDYGAGPAVIAQRFARMGAQVQTFDISPDMNRICEEKLGVENVFRTVGQIPKSAFDIVLCNLVLCIVPDDEVVDIMQNIKLLAKPGGSAFIGFCNPRIFDVSESVIDFRHPTGHEYEENHCYQKTKKEGGYHIEETHRPIGWYKGVFRAHGLDAKPFFTPSYEVADGREISDFVIFRVSNM